MDAAAHAKELRDQGYTVFERAYDPDWVDGIRAEILADYEALGSPPAWSDKTEILQEDVVVCMAGVSVHGLLPRLPHRASSLLTAKIVASLRDAIGPDMYMEVAGWVISDKRRPFFDWHVHINGQDDSVHLRSGSWPKVDSIQRVMALLYLEDLGAEHGSVLIYPRKLGDPHGPPQPREAHDWDGQVELQLPRGSLLAIDQCTWHAVRQQRDEGLRIWVCCTFASPASPRSSWFDARLLDYQTDDALLGSVLPAR